MELTKRRAREAAIVEFAAHGEHGTTMERIAARAGVNKQRIYAYFGDKAALFQAVVWEEIEKVTEAVPLVIERSADVGEFAGQSLGDLQAHPDLARLVLWEGLADVGAVPEEPARSALYRRKLDVIGEAQRNGMIDDALEPAYLVFMLLALASWWTAQPQTARMLTGADPSAPRERTKRRAAVVDAAMRLAGPVGGPGAAHVRS